MQYVKRYNLLSDLMKQLHHHDKNQTSQEFQNVPIDQIDGESMQEVQIKKDPTWRARKKTNICVVVILVLLIFVVAIEFFRSPNQQLTIIPHKEVSQHAQHAQMQNKSSTNNQQGIDSPFFDTLPTPTNTNDALSIDKNFAKVIWVQTDDELQTKQMEIAVTAQNLIHFTNNSDFDIRIVNNHNAYDWLSKEMIEFLKETHQKSKFDIPIYQLLRLALLIEHGGVSVRLPNILLMENLDWVANLFEGNMGNQSGANELSCKNNRIETICIHQGNGSGLRFKDDFIASKPSSKLLRIVLSQFSRVIKEGNWPYADFDIVSVNQDTTVASLPGIAEALINIINKQYTYKHKNLCQQFHLQSFHKHNGKFMSTVPPKQSSKILKISEKEFEKSYGKKYLLLLNIKQVVNDIAKIIKTGDLSFGDGNSLLKNKVMMVEGNKWLTKPKQKIRKVHLCIVSLKVQPLLEYQKIMKQQLDYFQAQTFLDWNLVNFVQNYTTVLNNISQKVTIVNASSYEGLNLQRAATRYCHPASIIFLLDYDETLSTQQDLQQIAKMFEPVGVFAGFFHFRNGPKVFSPSYALREVRRQTNRPNRLLLHEISNLLRAFTVESYRFIAPFDLRHSSGRYFDRELPLLSMLQVAQHFAPCEQGNIVYQVRRLQEHMTIPKKKVFTNLTINSDHYRIPDLSKYQYFGKLRHKHICGTIQFYQQYVAPVEMMAVFNDGSDEMGLAARKDLPEIMPRKIHQIWVKGEIPKFKQYLMKRLKDAHPDYQYFLWSQSNITKENFPEGYDLMQTLMEWDKKSPYNKMSVISDIIRSEAVHKYGGFYLDTNYMLFGDRPLDQFLSYSFVTAGELSPRQRMFRDTAIFGAVQHSPRLARLISHRTLSTRNFYSKRAAKEAGPGLFGRALRGKEEQEKDVFQPGFEEFYPNFIYDPGNYNYNKCEATPNTPQEDILFRGNTKSYLKNCSKIYSYAFGLDFFGEGLSWLKRRW